MNEKNEMKEMKEHSPDLHLSDLEHKGQHFPELAHVQQSEASVGLHVGSPKLHSHRNDHASIWAQRVQHLPQLIVKLYHDVVKLPFFKR